MHCQIGWVVDEVADGLGACGRGGTSGRCCFPDAFGNFFGGGGC